MDKLLLPKNRHNKKLYFTHAAGWLAQVWKQVLFALRVSSEEAPKIQTVKSTACASKKNKPFHRKAFLQPFTLLHTFSILLLLLTFFSVRKAFESKLIVTLAGLVKLFHTQWGQKLSRTQGKICLYLMRPVFVTQPLLRCVMQEGGR